MGTGSNSTRENVRSGTCSPLANTADEAATPLNTELDDVAPGPVTMVVAPFAVVLVGPRDNPVADEPPETSPAFPPLACAPVRLYRSRRSRGLFLNDGNNS